MKRNDICIPTINDLLFSKTKWKLTTLEAKLSIQGFLKQFVWIPLTLFYYKYILFSTPRRNVDHDQSSHKCFVGLDHSQSQQKTLGKLKCQTNRHYYYLFSYFVISELQQPSGIVTNIKSRQILSENSVRN